MGFIDGLLEAIFGPKQTVADTENNTAPSSPSRRRVLGSFYSKVAGVTFNNNDGTSRQKILSQCQVGEYLYARHEPIRGHPEAVALYRANGEQVGWLNAGIAAEIAERLDKGAQVDVMISDLTGGSFGKTRGCNILITRYALR